MRRHAKEGQPRSEAFVLHVSKTVGERGHGGVISSVMERHWWCYQTGASAATNVSACKHKVIAGQEPPLQAPGTDNKSFSYRYPSLTHLGTQRQGKRPEG